MQTGKLSHGTANGQMTIQTQTRGWGRKMAPSNLKAACGASAENARYACSGQGYPKLIRLPYRQAQHLYNIWTYMDQTSGTRSFPGAIETRKWVCTAVG